MKIRAPGWASNAPVRAIRTAEDGQVEPVEGWPESVPAVSAVDGG
ncbi:hypothetical protein [Nocardia sp. NPDC058480]